MEEQGPGGSPGGSSEDGQPVGELHDIAEWRARRAATLDVAMGAPPFVLEEPCPGCGSERVSTMVWRRPNAESRSRPFPRIAPHFLCRRGRVVWQDITDSPLTPNDWKGILGHFEGEEAGSSL